MVIKAASDPLTKSGIGIDTVYSQIVFRQETEKYYIYIYQIVLREIISTFFPLNNMKFIFIYPFDWKCKKDNEFVVLMYKQQF